MYPNSMTIGETYDDYLRRNEGELDLSDLLYDLNNHWANYEWEQGELIDSMPEEHQNSYVMTCEVDGMTFEGTGTYSCGELILIENVEHKIK